MVSLSVTDSEVFVLVFFGLQVVLQTLKVFDPIALLHNSLTVIHQ